MASEIQFTRNIQPIAISRNRLILGNRGVVAGWGHREQGPNWGENFAPTPSNDLQFIETDVLSHNECLRRMHATSIFFLNRNHLCTFAVRGRGACTFDSGSPVVADGEVVGIVAFVVGCGLGFPVSFSKEF